MIEKPEVPSVYCLSSAAQNGKVCVRFCVSVCVCVCMCVSIYTGCPRGSVSDFERMFLTLKYTDITQNTYVRS